jgi:hypothetical protein
VLKQNNMSVREEPRAARGAARGAGLPSPGRAAAVTYEPYLSRSARWRPGRSPVTTLDYPVVVDTLSFSPEFIQRIARTCRRWSTTG